MTEPVQIQPAAARVAVDAAVLRKEMESRIEGEVRFDAVTRSLYSTDASVYQIEPVGVVIPRHREDILRALEICRRHGCPITMRGGGTSQCGQSIGPGIQMDISKHYNRILEINEREKWVRVEPGIVLDELNAQLAPLQLRFAPDISTASRATMGGMMSNNAAGARSVWYGKTIDHVLEMVVALADGSVADFREIPRGEEPGGDTLEAACYRTVLGLAAKHAGEIGRRYPKILRRVGGYNLDEFTDPAKPVNLAKLMVGSEGTLGIILEAKLRLVELPKAKAVMVIMFDDLLQSLAATSGDSAAPALGGGGDGQVDPGLYAAERRAGRHPATHIIEGDPASTLCVEFYADRKEDLPPRLDALEEDLRAQQAGLRVPAETDAANTGENLASAREASLGLSTAMKGRRQVHLLRGRHGGGAGEAARLYRTIFAIMHHHGTTAGIYAHASVGCLHVRPVINLKTEEGDSEVRSHGAAGGGPGAGVRRLAFGRTRRRADAQPVQPADVRPELYEAFREVKRTFDPRGHFESRQNCGCAAVDVESALRRRNISTPDPPTWFDYSACGGMGARGGNVQRRGRLPQETLRARCARRTWPRATRRIHARPRQCAAPGDDGPAGGSRAGRPGRLRSAGICLECRACKVRMSDGRGHGAVSRASFWPITRSATERRSAPARWGTSTAFRFGAAGWRRWPNWLIASPLVRRLLEEMLGIDRQRTLPAMEAPDLRAMAGRNPASQSMGGNGSHRAVQRHVPELLRAGNRQRPCGGFWRGAGAAWMWCGPAVAAGR